MATRQEANSDATGSSNSAYRSGSADGAPMPTDVPASSSYARLMVKATLQINSLRNDCTHINYW